MPIPLLGKQKSPWLLVLILFLVLGGGAIALRTITQNAGKPDIDQDTVIVKSEPLKFRIKASGSVVPVQTVNLSPKVSGRLVELLVEQGDKVTKGQIIARMDDESTQAQLAEARANLNAAQVNLEKLRNGSRVEDIAAAKARVETARNRANLSRTRAERYRDLAKQGAITSDRMDELDSDLRVTGATLREAQIQLELLQNGARREDIAQAEAQAAQAQARLKNIEIQQEDTVIRSPFDGLVTQKYATVGAFVTPTTSASSTSSATSTSIVAVAKGLEILAKVPEVDVGQIAVNQTVEVIADAFPDKVFQGQVRLIAPEAIVEQNVTSFQVRVKLETGQNELQSGMNANLTFIGRQIDNALVVPTVAITTENGQTGLLIPDQNNKSQFRAVTIGSTIDNKTQILKGIQAGDRVFIKLPAQNKAPGQ
jgi:HlyD family secretion protein